MTIRQIYSQKRRKIHSIFSLFAAVFVSLISKIDSYTLKFDFKKNIKALVKMNTLQNSRSKTKYTF